MVSLQFLRGSPSSLPRLFPVPRFLSLLCLLLARALAYTELSDETLRSIPSAGSDFDIQNGKLLAPILIPRVPGTAGAIAAQNHFLDFFHDGLPNWNIDIHNASWTTPSSGTRELPFANLIFRRDPPWATVGNVGRLTLVAHYDSLSVPQGFIGATDSAAPCAMLLHVARSIDAALEKRWADMMANGEAGSGLEEEKGVQILLLDGEEAFVRWTNTDSLYGARALARDWEDEAHPAMSTYKSPLDSISLFVLLDLLGSSMPYPRVPSYFRTTHWAYRNMARIESRMRAMGLLSSKPTDPFLIDGQKESMPSDRKFIQDDHVPFMARGVDILHLIPSPFPDVWHKMEDDGAHLDLRVCDDWAKIVTAFTAEWMDLEGHLPKLPGVKAKRELEDEEEAKAKRVSKTEL